jgi:hypothetical protein
LIDYVINEFFVKMGIDSQIWIMISDFKCWNKWFYP